MPLFHNIFLSTFIFHIKLRVKNKHNKFHFTKKKYIRNVIPFRVHNFLSHFRKKNMKSKLVFPNLYFEFSYN